MTEKRFRCRCGGVLIFDEARKTTAHSLPACDMYYDLCKTAQLEGFELRDGKTGSLIRKMKPGDA